MKLSKHKISKLLKHKKQSQKQLNKNKIKNKNKNNHKHKSHTFRNSNKKRKHVNLRTKTLKKYFTGGVKLNPTIIAEKSNPTDVTKTKTQFSAAAESPEKLQQHKQATANEFTIFPAASSKKKEVISQIDFITERNNKMNGNLSQDLLTPDQLSQGMYKQQWQTILNNAGNAQLTGQLQNGLGVDVDGTITQAINSTEKLISDDINTINQINKIIIKGNDSSPEDRILLNNFQGLINNIKKNMTLLKAQNDLYTGREGILKLQNDILCTAEEDEQQKEQCRGKYEPWRIRQQQIHDDEYSSLLKNTLSAINEANCSDPNNDIITCSSSSLDDANINRIIQQKIKKINDVIKSSEVAQPQLYVDATAAPPTEAPPPQALVEPPPGEALVEPPPEAPGEALVEPPPTEALVEPPPVEALVEGPPREALVEAPPAEALVEPPPAEALVEEVEAALQGEKQKEAELLQKEKAVQEELDALKQKTEKIEQNIGKVERAKANAEEKISTLEQQITKKSDQIDTALQRIDELKQQQSTANEETRVQLDKAIQEQAEIQGRVAEEIKQQQLDLKFAKTTTSEAETFKTRLRNDLKKVSSKERVLNDENESIKRSLEFTQRSFAYAERRQQEMNQQLQLLTQQKIAAEASAAATREQVVSAREDAVQSQQQEQEQGAMAKQEETAKQGATAKQETPLAITSTSEPNGNSNVITIKIKVPNTLAHNVNDEGGDNFAASLSALSGQLEQQQSSATATAPATAPAPEPIKFNQYSKLPESSEEAQQLVDLQRQASEEAQRGWEGGYKKSLKKNKYSKKYNRKTKRRRS